MNKEIQYGYDKTKTSYVSDSTKGKTLCKEEHTTCEIVQENQQFQNNWNELKEKIKKALEELDKADYEYTSRSEYIDIIMNTKEILQELESRK